MIEVGEDLVTAPVQGHLIPFDGVSELGRTQIGRVTVAAHDQVVIDAYGGVNRMAEEPKIS